MDWIPASIHFALGPRWLTFRNLKSLTELYLWTCQSWSYKQLSLHPFYRYNVFQCPLFNFMGTFGQWNFGINQIIHLGVFLHNGCVLCKKRWVVKQLICQKKKYKLCVKLNQTIERESNLKCRTAFDNNILLNKCRKEEVVWKWRKYFFQKPMFCSSLSYYWRKIIFVARNILRLIVLIICDDKYFVFSFNGSL